MDLLQNSERNAGAFKSAECGITPGNDPETPMTGNRCVLGDLPKTVENDVLTSISPPLE